MEFGPLARITRHGEMVTQAAIRPSAWAANPAAARVFLQATHAARRTRKAGGDVCGESENGRRPFCGLGPFALRLAENCRVTAIDSDQPAIDALARAAQSSSGLKPVTARRRDLFRGPLSALELSGFDAIVFDPPRQGAEAQAREIAKSEMPKRDGGVLQRGDISRVIRVS